MNISISEYIKKPYIRTMPIPEIRKVIRRFADLEVVKNVSLMANAARIRASVLLMLQRQNSVEPTNLIVSGYPDRTAMHLHRDEDRR